MSRGHVRTGGAAYDRGKGTHEEWMRDKLKSLDNQPRSYDFPLNFHFRIYSMLCIFFSKIVWMKEMTSLSDASQTDAQSTIVVIEDRPR